MSPLDEENDLKLKDAFYDLAGSKDIVAKEIEVIEGRTFKVKQ